MSKAVRLASVCPALTLLILAVTLSAPSNAQNSTFFTPGNLVVAVEGCGVHGGTCTNVPSGKGVNGGYGDNQAAPLTLFQYSPNGTSSISFVNSLTLPQLISGADFPVSGEYGSSSEASINLSSGGQYLTIMGYGIDAPSFNLNPLQFGSPSLALAQSGSLTGQSYTPVPRMVALIDANGNVNSSTALYNIFNTNNPRSAFTADGTTVYVSGQGSGSDATAGVFYVPIGQPNTNPTAITGLDATDGSVPPNPISQDTRSLQVFNNTLYVSVDTKGGKNSARSFVGTLGTPPATGLFNSSAGPTQLNGFGTSKTGKLTITTGANGNGNNLNSGDKINLSPVNYFFATPAVLYVADSGNPKNDSNGDNNSNGTTSIGDGGLQKWVNVAGTWTLEYTLYQGLNLVNNGGTNGTTGLYGLTGTVSGNTVFLYTTNYTLNDLDPTYLYGITDNLTFTTASQAVGETFTQLEAAPVDSNFKGVSLTPTIPAGSVEVTTSPSGLSFTSSGTGCAPGTYTSPVTLAWTPGSSCTLTVATPQAGATGVQYTLTQWEDGTTGASHTVTAPTTTATYTASFNTQYLLTTSAGTGGTVNSGGYYNAGTNATITATPSTGYGFVNFTGSATSTSNPFTLAMNAPQSIMANFTVLTAQTITVTTAPPANAAYGSNFTVAATASSGLPVAYSSSGSCSNSGLMYTMTSSSGTCSVIFDQAGNGTYAAAPTVTLLSNATPATTAISVSSVSPAAEDYGQDAPVTITAVLSWSGAGAAPTGAATIGGSGTSGYGTTTCGAASGNTITCTSTYTPTSSDGPASYTETAAFAGDGNYSSSGSSQTNNFTINQATSTVTVGSSLNPSAYNQQVTFTATINGEFGLLKRRPGKVKPQDIGGSVTWSDDTGCGTTPVTGNPGIATCVPSTLAIGNNAISASYSGDGNHSGSVGALNGGQVVNPANQTISFTTNAPASAVYNSSFTVAANANTGLPITYSSAGVCSNSGPTYTMTSGTGICTVTASQAGTANYAPASSSELTAATQISETVSFTTNAPPKAVYNTSFTVSATSSSGLPVVFLSSGSCTNSGATYTMTNGTGTCTVTASQPGNANYSAAPSKNESVGAELASQTSTFSISAPASAVYGSTFTIAASSTSGLPITYLSGGTCTNSGPTYTLISGTGSCTVTASQPGNGNYSPAPYATEFTTAMKATPTTSFIGAPATAQYAASFMLIATSNASIVAAILVNNPTACQLSGSVAPVTVNIVKSVGVCKFTATWNPDANYAGSTIIQSTTLMKAPTSVTWATPAPISYGTALSSTQLDATASQSGTLTYNPAIGAFEPAGTKNLLVTFKPSDTNYATSTAMVVLQVQQDTTVTTITSSSSTVTLNSNGVAMATVAFNVTSYKPTGAVTLTASTGEVCSAAVSAVTGNGSCKLTFTTTGTRTVVASYGGDANHTSSDSLGQTPPVTVTVNRH